MKTIIFQIFFLRYLCVYIIIIHIFFIIIVLFLQLVVEIIKNKNKFNIMYLFMHKLLAT